MKTLAPLTLLLLCSLFACKKEKTYNINGKLLLCRSNPVPVKNASLQIYQSGNAGAPIALGTYSSSAKGYTDNDGYFSIRFKNGGGTFFGLPVSNNNPVRLSKDPYDNVLPSEFIVDGLTNLQNASLGPLYLYKKIDTLYLKIASPTGIVATDSFTFYASNQTGTFVRTKRGLTAAPNTEILLDTVQEAAFFDFNFSTKKYINRISIQKNTALLSSRAFGQDSLSENDEKSRTLRFTVY